MFCINWPSETISLTKSEGIPFICKISLLNSELQEWKLVQSFQNTILCFRFKPLKEKYYILVFYTSLDHQANKMKWIYIYDILHLN